MTELHTWRKQNLNSYHLFEDQIPLGVGDSILEQTSLTPFLAKNVFQGKATYVY